MFDANHDVCFLGFVNDVNVHSKFKSAKRSKKKNIWKPPGKVFTDIGYRWKPIGRTFTIDGNTCSKHMTGNRSQLINFVHKLLEVVAIACLTQNQSLIRKCHNKTPYELLHNKKSDLSYLRIFGALCYPTNDNEDLGQDIGIFVGYAPSKKAFQIYNKRTRLIIKTVHVDFNELTTMASKIFILGLEPHLLTLRIISPGLMPNHLSPTPYVPPTKKDWDILLQPMFDEYFFLLPNAPSPSTSQTPQDSQSLVSSLGVVEESHDIKVAHLDNNPFFGVPSPEPNFEESPSSDVIPANAHSMNQPPEHLNKWTKDHSLDNVTGNPSRPTSTTKQSPVFLL
nr:hypothetical protein [Tanacetum cinerariifolium]